MDRNVGASFTLSVLTVIAFAVVLYQPDKPAAAVRGPESASGPRVEVVEARDPDAVASARPERVVEAVRRDPVGLEPSRPAVPVRAVSGSERTLPAVAARPAVPLPAARVSTDSPSEPRGAFTTVRDGEDLAAVARRVYGSEDEASRLWRANRDQLDREDAPLRRGALLRTP